MSKPLSTDYRFCAGKTVAEMLGPSYPRFAVVTQRHWMEAYCSLDEGELQHRTASVLAHTDGFALWMGALALCHRAFSHPYRFDTDPIEKHASALLRLDLLVLACGNIKLALDAALAGYYSGAMSLERHMLETWRRVAYIRLHPEDIWRWIPQNLWPEDVKPASDRLSVEKGGMPTRIPKADQIAATVSELGDDNDRRILARVRDGFDFLSDHSHPSFDGATQTWRQDDLYRRYFGPTYTEFHATTCLEWGHFASVFLLIEVEHLAPQGAEWNRELADLKVAMAKWGLGERDK